MNHVNACLEEISSPHMSWIAECLFYKVYVKSKTIVEVEAFGILRAFAAYMQAERQPQPAATL